MNVIFQGIDSPPDLGMGPDHVEYEQLARNVINGNGYVLDQHLKVPNTLRAPGTSLLLAIFYGIFGIHYYVARILFITISSLTCIVTYFLGAKLGGRKMGIAAALILALYPMHFYYSMHLFSEVPFAFFISLAILAAILMREKKSVFFAVLLGLFSGMSALTRSLAIFYLPAYILLLCLFREKGESRTLIKLSAISIVSFTLCISPWVVRNYIVTGHIVPVSTHGGVTFLGAHNEIVLRDPALIGYYAEKLDDKSVLYRKDMTVYAKDREAYRAGFDFLKEHLSDIPRLELMKLYRAITPFYNTPNKMFNLIGGVSWLILMPFAFLGIIITLKNRSFVPLLAAVALTLAVVLFFYGDHRFREAIAPVLVLYGSAGLFFCGNYVLPSKGQPPER